MAVEVRRATPSDRDALAAMLSRAFADDPVMTWFFPDDDRRTARCELFFRRVVLDGPYARVGDVYTTDGLESAAIWLPPDKWRLGFLDQLRFLPAILRILPVRWLASRLAAFNQIEARHP
ncbi:MAG TPA: hypothetical protein VGU73_10020, partial [Acidimicrobiia bacterium]|nr:hypothetical protein [Acidimicrobiia bacterium]